MNWFFVICALLLIGYGVLLLVANWWPIFFGDYRRRVDQEIERLSNLWRVPETLSQTARKAILQNKSKLRVWIQRSHANPSTYSPERFASMILEATVLSEIRKSGSLAAMDSYRRYIEQIQDPFVKSSAIQTLDDESRRWGKQIGSFVQFKKDAGGNDEFP